MEYYSLTQIENADEKHAEKVGKNQRFFGYHTSFSHIKIAFNKNKIDIENMSVRTNVRICDGV